MLMSDLVSIQAPIRIRSLSCCSLLSIGLSAGGRLLLLNLVVLLRVLMPRRDATIVVGNNVGQVLVKIANPAALLLLNLVVLLLIDIGKNVGQVLMKIANPAASFSSIFFSSFFSSFFHPLLLGQ